MPRTPHITPDRLAALLGEDELLAIAGLGGHNSPGGRMLDTGRIADAVAHADRTVDAYTRGRYPQGTARNGQPHPLLEAAAADLARYRLRSSANANSISDEVRRRHEDAMRLLRDVQAGRTALTDDDGLPLGEADGEGGSVQSTTVAAAMPRARAPAILEGFR